MQPERFGDRYRVIARIGAGGSGVVFSGQDERLGRAVAIKHLSARTMEDPAARKRLLREAHAVARLDHPAVIRIYDIGDTEAHGAFLVMELIRGQSLRRHLRAGTMSPKQRLRALVEVARGLGAAHRAGLVHRDVKPDNIMIRDDGHAVVLDFGLAKDLDASGLKSTLTGAGVLVGTPEYFAPEQAQGAHVSPAADQYAFGVVVYETFSGRLPWNKKGRAQLLVEIASGEPLPLTAAWPGAPRELATLVARTMARAPRDRFADMEQVARALELIEPQIGSVRVPPGSAIARVAYTPGSSDDETRVASDAVRAVVRSPRPADDPRPRAEAGSPRIAIGAVDRAPVAAEGGAARAALARLMPATRRRDLGEWAFYVCVLLVGLAIGFGVYRLTR